MIRFGQTFRNIAFLTVPIMVTFGQIVEDGLFWTAEHSCIQTNFKKNPF